MRLTDVFAALGLRRPGSTAIDVPALLAADVRDTLARAVAGVLSAVVALADPAVVLLGGAWGREVLDAVARAFAPAPRSVPVEPATKPVLTAVRESALQRLRDAVVSGATQG